MSVSNLYEILGISSTATANEVKSAFRKSALQHHPDRNSNSIDSTTRFRVIYNAYTVLSNPAKRREYDTYLRMRSVFGISAASTGDSPVIQQDRRIPAASDTFTMLLNHLNSILWDIEDLIRTKPDWNRSFSGLCLRGYVQNVLAFIDKWILSAAGFPDYFFQARKMTTPSDTDLLSDTGKPGHRPYVHIIDYFYNIRSRTDKLLNAAKLVDLFEPVSGTDVRIIDCVIEAYNYGVHCIGHLKSALAGELETIPPFHHSNSCFNA